MPRSNKSPLEAMIGFELDIIGHQEHTYTLVTIVTTCHDIIYGYWTVFPFQRFKLDAYLMNMGIPPLIIYYT
ncbi:hypothetical protein AFLA_002632 [Aspergillus flavus NRRL3357]|nr:hypothetical protein AFLA_002632 [Aspergillus flavus NRRL3357]